MNSPSSINIEPYIENDKIDEAIELINEKFKNKNLSSDERIKLYILLNNISGRSSY